MASPAELGKLIENMKRGGALVDRAVKSVDKDAETMNRFEARLDVKDGFMSQISEYEKQMAAMDAIGNGGPPLDGETFQQGAEKPAPGAGAVGVTAAPVVPAIPPAPPPIHRDTGDPIK